MCRETTTRTATPEVLRTREGGLDALRAGAMLLGVLFHAAVPHALTPMRGLPWPVSDAASSRLLDVLFWASHAFRMPLFFLLSGFLAVRALERKTVPAFLAARARRLGLPLVVPGLAVLVVLYFVWCTGWWLDGRCTPGEIRAMKFADPQIRSAFLGSAHLWFLGDLLVVSFLWAGARMVTRTRGTSRFVVPACTLGAMSLAALAPEVSTAFRNGFLPDPGRLAWHALYFVAGAALADTEAEGRRHGASPGPTPVAVPAVAAVLGFVAAYPRVASVSAGTASVVSRALFAAGWTLFAWGAALALFALARRRKDPAGPRLALLAESSFWIYLVHVPIVGAFQISLASGRLPPVAAWALAAIGAAGVSLLGWLAVRRTALGSHLAGVRPRG